MAIIIIEGGELVGKTSVVRALQDMIPYHTLVKLSGYPTSVVSNTEERGMMVAKQYNNLGGFISVFSEDKYRTLIFDRYSTTERVMFPESFSYGRMMSSLRLMKVMGAKQFILTAPVDILKARYDERRRHNSLENQTFHSIIDIHRKYVEESRNTPIDTTLISNDGSYTVQEIAEHIVALAGVKIHRIDD